ncbi:uncharacterized protein F5Z01DRAFT_638447 [Emericellopsis atlantica]|uniref:Uncharacterized protein n=1 Tax=Emericellopsis atlantica TaxID=2614577 RepID=A0A9P8CNW6_9HYPO|nr:uncharacterized protein F5Z01DRAFT_638447 [Emericellopsis atlantica]KAG9252166.1 hypothetical protein F5Z01DRAFT_638447 [Emericellopsis atlantica]
MFDTWHSVFSVTNKRTIGEARGEVEEGSQRGEPQVQEGIYIPGNLRIISDNGQQRETERVPTNPTVTEDTAPTDVERAGVEDNGTTALPQDAVVNDDDQPAASNLEPSVAGHMEPNAGKSWELMLWMRWGRDQASPPVPWHTKYDRDEDLDRLQHSTPATISGAMLSAWIKYANRKALSILKRQISFASECGKNESRVACTINTQSE